MFKSGDQFLTDFKVGFYTALLIHTYMCSIILKKKSGENQTLLPSSILPNFLCYLHVWLLIFCMYGFLKYINILSEKHSVSFSLVLCFVTATSGTLMAKGFKCHCLTAYPNFCIFFSCPVE